MRLHFPSPGHVSAVECPQAPVRVAHGAAHFTGLTPRTDIHTGGHLHRGTGLGLLWQDRACPYLTLAGVQKDANSASGRHHRDTDPSAQVVAREFPQVAHDVIFKFGVDCNCITRLSARLFSDSPRQSVH